MSVVLAPGVEDAHRTVAHAVAASGTSFFWAMRLLPSHKRRGMFALYAYCRAVDDIADGAAPPLVKRARLDAWRAALDARPGPLIADPAYVAIADARARFALPTSELIAVLDGVATDANGPIVAPNLAAFDLYCRRVAGAVGVLILHVVGRPDAHDLALRLGLAFQCTNVLRDLEEDAVEGRLYVPREDLVAAGLALPTDPAATLADPAFEHAFARLIDRAAAAFAAADAVFAGLDPRGLRPVKMMTTRYRALFDRVRAVGWPRDPRALRLGRLAKARLLARAVLRPGC